MKTCLWFLLVAYTTLCNVANSQTDYCRICRNHTLCIYPDQPAARCNQHLFSGISEADKALIVNLHNAYRTKVASGNEPLGSPGPQPQASNMRKLVWDNELARVAKVWAEQCIVATDACRNVPRFVVGQNVMHSACRGTNCSVTPDWNGAFVLWRNSVTGFNRTHVDSYQYFNNTGTYTQIVWATTSTLGCSCTVYKDVDGRTKQLYVCDYGISGNILLDPVYKRGTPCTACRTTCSSDGTLCN